MNHELIFNLQAVYFTEFISSFLLTVALLLILKPFSQQLGLIDMPDARKAHARATPVIGGVAMMIAISAVILKFETLNSELYHILFAIAIIGITGILDDRHDIQPRFKFASQALAALVIILLCDLKVTNLGNLFGFGEVHLPSPLAEFMTVVCIVGVINAINMADGLDGLAAGIVTVSSLAFAYMALSVDNFLILNLIMITVGAVSAFLLFNLGRPLRPHALVFMGDAGSMVLGLLLAGFAIHVTSESTPGHVPPIIAVWVIGVPLMDMASVMLRRYRRRLKLTAASNLHLHHMLLKAGYSRHHAALVKVLLTALSAGIGLLAWHFEIPDYIMFYGFFLLLFLYHRCMTRHDDAIATAALG